ncbi:hypothetical protein [Bacillus sp. FSL K6-6540]|uniref:hypothetical protein n=1 Tax=Bacillus sp. FSL K6-6540 TaxID=2921512 RepID=UPI004046FC62
MLVLSATITIFLGVKGIPGSENIAVILGAILTASGGFKVFHRYEEQISNLSKTFHELRLLDSELSFYYKSVPLVDIKEELLLKLKERLQTILRNHAVSVINFKSNEIN